MLLKGAVYERNRVSVGLPLGLKISGSDLRAKARFCACSVMSEYTDN